MKNFMDVKRKHVNEEELVAELSWIVRTFQDGACVLKVIKSDGKTASAIGNPGGAKLSTGLTYRMMGRWFDHAQYGPQFRFSSIIADTPHSRRGVVEYLRTYVSGVGLAKAEQLWEKFGVKCIEVLRDDPGSIVKAKILPEAVATAASEELKGMSELQKTTVDLMTLLSGRGFPRQTVQRCIEAWGTNAPAVIKENAFQMIHHRMPGAGFRRVDGLFLDLEGDPSCMDRQMFAAWYAISSDMDGHTWFKGSRIATKIRELVGGSKINPGEAIAYGVEKGFLRVSGKGFDFKKCSGLVTESGRADAEILLAKSVKAIQGVQVKWPHHVDKDCYPELSEHQLDVVLSEINGPLCFLTGSPGTGKTYTLAAIVKRLLACNVTGGKVAICAPTGKAAVRCTEAMNRYSIRTRATTIHSLLGVQMADDGSMELEHGPSSHIDFDIIIVDEVSMCDTRLLASLLSSIRPGSRVLLVGDKNQLPPVGHGAPLRDLMKLFVKKELTEIQRNAGAIVRTCHAIRDAKDFDVPLKFAPSEGQNMRLVPAYKVEDQLAAIEKIARDAIKSKKIDPFCDMQFIVATNKSTQLSRIPLNAKLQDIFNPTGFRASGNPLRVGDKVICLENGIRETMTPRSQNAVGPFDPVRDFLPSDSQAFVANGDIGYVLAVDARLAIVAFECPKRIVKILVRNGADGEASTAIELAYAVTCHKMQGSQAKVIVIVIDGHPSSSFICSREWVYTAISRAEDFVILVGDLDVMKRHCRRVSIGERKTLLVERLSK